MPAPDDGDVFLDFEGHPFWRADVGLFFLFGWIERDVDRRSATWEFKALWAHDQAEEAAATKQLVDYLDARRQRFPNMHVYHYNHTERSSLVRLTMEHGVAELELERLIETGMFVDLYPIITASLQAGTESYGLKQMERLAELRARPRDRPGRRRGRRVRAAGWPTATPTISPRSPPTTRTTSGRPERCATGSSNSGRRRRRGVRRCSTRTSPTRSSTRGSRRSTRSAPAPTST